MMKENAYTQLPVIIVGGGLSALSAAALLARAGYAVTLFEKASVPGGRARTKKQSGFSFNQGAHGLYKGGSGEKLLSELGVRYSGSIPARDNDLAFDHGKVHTLPTNAISMVGTSLLKFAAKWEMIHIFSSLKRVKLAELQNMSFHDWLEQQVRYSQVRQFLLAGARAATYTNAPDLIPASLVIPLLTSQVYYLDGGWQTLVDGLWQRVQEAGVRIMTRVRVAKIERAGEAYTVRLADGTEHAASAVLIATDPEMASSLVADGTHEALSRWAAQSIPARVACLDIALHRLPRPRNLFAIGLDCPLYYSVHSATASLAPKGSALIHLIKYLQPGKPVEPEATRQELEGLMDLLQPAWRTEVVEQYYLPQMVATNAIVQARHGGLLGRPGPAVPGLPNLYVAGDWVGAEGQLAEASFASARSAADMIMAALAVRRSASPVY